jgi:hypothetical protein
VWEAVEVFCRAAGLREMFAADYETPTPPANRTYHFTPVRPTADTVPVTLIDGEPSALPGARSRAVRVLALPPSFPGHRVTLGNGEIAFCLDVTPQPGLNWQDAPAVRVTRVVDDAGRIGAAGAPATRFDPLLPNVNGPRVAQFDRSAHPPRSYTFPNPRVVPVPLRVATPGAKSLRVLEGAVCGEVLVPGQTLAAIDNSAAAFDRPVTGPNGLRAEVLGIETAGDEVRVRVQLTVSSPWAARLRQNNAAGAPWPEPPRAVGLTNRWTAFDAAGRVLTPATTDLINVRDDGETLTLAHQLTFPRATGVPAKLCVVGPRRVAVEVAFRLENVPLP